MTMIAGAVGEWSDDAPPPLQRMLGAMRRTSDQRAAAWKSDSLRLGVLARDSSGLAESQPAQRDELTLWIFGEIFNAPSTVDLSTRDRLRSTALDAWRVDRRALLRQLDGEYLLAVWDSSQKRLTIANDRFGALPLYLASASDAHYFASSVRGIVASEKLAAAADVQAIREAVTFGGFRLAQRTNLEGVELLPNASLVELSPGAMKIERYWSWNDLQPVQTKSLNLLIDEAGELWRNAIRRRVSGAKRPGQTLSGGLDSRAILAEGTREAKEWTAITFGLPRCDDAIYAEKAAAAGGARWIFHELYQPGWLELRSSFIQETDGLIDLHDLAHLETVEQQRALLDVHLSGYIGDAVSGPTFTEVTTATDVMAKLPYFGGKLGLPWEEALAVVQQKIDALDGSAPRFALFEQKLPQSTNKWTAAWRPYFAVRRPFCDYAFFDFFQGLPIEVRSEQALYERWLLRDYPQFFAAIPNQKSGVPIGSSSLRLNFARGSRFAGRKARGLLQRIGISVRERVRNYTADEVYWAHPEVKHVMEGAILRADSIVAELFGRPRVQEVLADWFERGAAPAQVIGAMYVFEVYHRDLRSSLGTVQTEECEVVTLQ